MANNINWGKIYESTAWGSGVTDNNISWGKSYADLAGGGGFTGLLDTYSGAAAAYSLRQLSSTYSGNAIKVRRASDNAEQDIAFSNNELDTATLETFASGTDAFVTTWYDQSGNGNDIIQSTAAEQPQIVDNGSTITEGTKPSIDFSSSSELELTSVSISANAYSFFGVTNTSGSTSRALFRNRELGGFGTLEGVAFFELTNGNVIANTFMDDGQGNAILASTESVLEAYHLISTHYTLSTASLYIDAVKEGGSSMGSGTTPLSGPIDFPYINIGGLRFSRPWKNTIQEIILYDSDELSNRTGIETNINDFYSIY